MKKRVSGGSWRETLLIFALAASLPLVSIFLLFHMTAKTVESDICQSLEQAVEQRKIHFDFRLRSVRQEDENMMAAIYPYMCNDTGPAEQYQEYEELRAILSLYTSNEDISGIRFYVPDSKIYSNQGNTFRSLSELERSDESVSFLQNAGITWIETREVPVITSAGGLWRSSNVLTCVHSMRQSTDYNSLACVLMLDIDVSNFDELLTTDVSADQRGYLVNDAGVCLAAPDEGLLSQTVIDEEVMTHIRQTRSGSLNCGGRVYVYHRLDDCDWYVVMDYPDSVLSMWDSPLARFMLLMVIIVLIVVLAIVLILAYQYATNITISRINVSLEALNAGKAQPPEDKPGFLEPLHHLERNADQMVLTVKELMENRYRDQIAIAESQIKSLQAQIKSHFLYNTLDIIKWMILDNKTTDAVWMVNSLSRYLRQSINKGPVIIPLREELELSKTYLALMQKRFENRFSANIEVEDDVEDYRIPKLSLQPLLENALLHGILYSEKPEKELTVRAWVSEQSLHIEVEDNGDGMSEEKCRALEDGESGYGFSNVRKRLELFSGGRSECHVFSKEGVGTCISIQLPAVTDGETFGQVL